MTVVLEPMRVQLIAILCSLGCILNFPVVTLGDDYREFKSTDGATIEAVVVEASFTSVTIRRKDGREFKNVSLDLFTSEDRRYVREWLKAQEKAVSDADLNFDSRVKITVQKGVDDDMNSYGDIDDRVIDFAPGVVVDSEEIELTYRNVKGTLVIVGRGVIEKDRYVVLDKQNLVMDMMPRERSRWEGDRFQCRYDPDYGGFEYEGYLIVFRNKAGKVVLTKGSKSSWERNYQSLLDAKYLTGYDRNFSRESKLFSTFGLPRR